jgi:hypothetical protein
MAELNSILSGSLVFRDQGTYLSEIRPGPNSVTITGSLNVSGSRVTVNGKDLVQAITVLESGQGADQVKFGQITLWTSSMNDWSSSVKDNLIDLNSSAEALNTFTGSISLDSTELFTSASVQDIRITSLESSGSTQEIRLQSLESIAIVSSSSQIADLGFLTASIGGIVSSSSQISRLGFVTGSKFEDLDDIPDGIISSSLQVVTSLINQNVNLGTGNITSSNTLVNGSLELDFDGVTNYFNINVNGEDKIQVNEEGILKLFAQDTTPTPVEGGIYFGDDFNLYLGVND